MFWNFLSERGQRVVILMHFWVKKIYLPCCPSDWGTFLKWKTIIRLKIYIRVLLFKLNIFIVLIELFEDFEQIVLKWQLLF